MTTTSHTITPQQHLTIVKHLATGKGLDVVATITRIDRSKVLDIGAQHGYPDTEKLGWAADILAKKLDDEATTIPTHPDAGAIARDQRAQQPSLKRPAGVASTPAPAGPPPATESAAALPPAKPDEFRILINTAKGIDTKRIQNLANRILDDVVKLRGLVDEHQAKLASQRQAEQAKAAARAEVERLEQQLAAAKAKLRPTTTAQPTRATSTTDQPSAKTVRAWAAEEGIDCPTRGQVPAAVRKAYDQAHQGDAA